MGKLFGTDGIRGTVGENLTARDAFNLGRAICAMKAKPTVIIGQDTRVSSDMLSHAAASGVACGGGTAFLGGILPTAAVSYFVRSRGADFGIVVSASHNPPECNGLKVFDCEGIKTDSETERFLEENFGKSETVSNSEYGAVRRLSGCNAYEKFLCSCAKTRLEGKVFVLDCANGAASAIAPNVFRRLGARIIVKHCSRDGRSINKNCGALHAELLRSEVLRTHADGGFCYDGDADRLIALDETGAVLNGDVLLCMLALDMKMGGRLAKNTAIGTLHTNTGAERYLRKYGIELQRTDIGDKYVAARMRQTGACIGAEQSGHVILSEFEPTGDGILTSVKVAELAVRQPLSEFADIRLLPQYNTSVRVSDKNAVLADSGVRAAEEQARRIAGRILVRPSGTEPLIRVFAEAETYAEANKAAQMIAAAVQSAEK